MSNSTDEVQQLTIQAGGGTFVLGFGGQTTPALPHNANASTIETALNNLPALAPSGVRVGGAGPFTVRFTGAQVHDAPQALVTINGASLTGGFVNRQGLCSDPNFQHPSPWFAHAVTGYSGNPIYAIQGNSGSPDAAWIMEGTAPGVRYRVWATWNGYPINREPNTTYTVRDGANANDPILAIYTINQRNDPTGQTFNNPGPGGDPGKVFQLLGTIVPTATSVRVAVGYPAVGGSGDAVTADAIVLEALDPAPVVATVTRTQTGSTPATAGSLKFTQGAYLRSNHRYPTDNWNGSNKSHLQDRASLAFWLRIDTLRTSWPTLVLWGHDSTPFLVKFQAGQLELACDYHPEGAPNTARPISISLPTPLGVSHHWALVFDGSGTPQADAATLTIYRDGVLHATAPCDPADNGLVKRLNHGNDFDAVHVGPFNSDADATLDDVTIWGGYTLSSQDADDLTSRAKRTTQIAPANVLFATHGDGGALTANVVPLETGVTNRGVPDYDLPAFTAPTFNGSWGQVSTIGQGTLTYDAPLVYVPPVVVHQARVITDRFQAKGTALEVTFRNRAGGTALVPADKTAASFAQPGRRAAIHVRRGGAGPEEVHELVDVLWETNHDRDSILFVLPQGVAPVGPPDTARLVAPARWVTLADGECDAVDLPVTFGSPVSQWLAPGPVTMKAGYNLYLAMQTGVPVFGNLIKSMTNWLGGGPIRADDGMPDLAPGQTRLGTLLISGPPSATDPWVSRDLAGRTVVNPYYDNPTYGTAGQRMGFGTRSVPRKGTFEVVWDYLPGRVGDGEVKLFPGWGEPTGDQFRVWGGEPTIQTGTNGLNYRKTYTYECFDPRVNPGDPSGSPLSPTVYVEVGGGVTNVRVSVQAHASLPEAVWNTPPLAPPDYSAYYTAEVLQGAKRLRTLDTTAGNGQSNSRYEHWTPRDYFSWNGEAKDRADCYAAVARIEPVTGAVRAALIQRFPGWRWGGCIFRIVTATPHGLDPGAIADFVFLNGPPQVAVQTTDGVTLDLSTSTVLARVLSPTELLAYAPIDFLGQVKDLARVYLQAELNSPYVVHNRRRTIPLDVLADLANGQEADLQLVLPHAYAQAVPDLLPGGAEHPSTTALRLTFADLAASLDPGRKLIVELANEPWNSTLPFVYHLMHGLDMAGALPGRGATLKVTELDANGGIKTVVVDQAGTGYFTGRLVFTGPGTGADGYLKCNHVTGAATGAWVSAPGSGYGPPNATNPDGIPGVSVRLGQGTGAVLQVAGVSGGAITGVTVVAGGSGYVPNIVVFEGGSGSGAWATYAVDGEGAITTVTVGSGGSGYLPGDTILAYPPHQFAPGHAPGSFEDGMRLHTLLASKRVARLARAAFVAAGRPASDVRLLLNIGPGIYRPETRGTLIGHGLQSDATTQADEFSGNSYWTTLDASGKADQALIDRLTTDEILDVVTWLMADPGWMGGLSVIRNDLDAYGLTNVAVSSYEGGPDLSFVQTPSPAYHGTNEAALVAQAKQTTKQYGVMRSPRMYDLTLASLRRFQERGTATWLRYPAHMFIYSRARDPHVSDYHLWGDYVAFGQRAGLGDGSDGLWDNRPSPNNLFAAHREGDSVSPGARALKDWSLMGDGDMNHPPVLTLPIGPIAGTVGQPVTFTATATDVDAGQTLTFSLGGTPPSGAVIHPASGVFSWTPSVAGDTTVTVVVTDNGTPPENDSGTVLVQVAAAPPTNQPPTLTIPATPFSIILGNRVAFTAVATDPDPDQTLTFSLVGTPPISAMIHPITGVFSWTPTELGSHTIMVRVTDNGSPPMSDTKSVLVHVAAPSSPSRAPRYVPPPRVVPRPRTGLR